MGTTPEQPLTLICDFKESKFYIVSIDERKLKTLKIDENLDWAKTVAFNHGKMEGIKETTFYSMYEPKTKDMDLVIGSIVDDRMFYVMDNFFNGYITDNALIASLSALKLGKQYVAITEKACKEIKIEKEIELSFFEKEILKKTSQKNAKRE